MDNSPTSTRDAPLQFDEDAGDGSVWNGTWLVLCGLAELVFVALRLWRLTDSCLWFDEIFSLHAARHDWRAMLRFVAGDVIHPPLFYVLLKAWTTFGGGESLAWLRLLPALISVATIAPFVSLCRALRLTASETTLALTLMAFNGYLIKYAQELRMYSLLLFFACCSLRLFVGYCNARAGVKRHLAALFVVNLLLVYTHYYGWLVVASELVWLVVFAARRKLRLFSITATALVVVFSPWVYAVVRAAAASEGLRQNIGWMTRPDLRAVVQFYVTLNEILYYPQSNTEPLFSRWSAPLGLLLFGVPVAALLARHAFRRRAARQAPPAATHADETTRKDSTQETRAADASTDEHTLPDDDTAAEACDSRRAPVLHWLLLFFVLPLALAFFASWLLPYSVWGTRHLIIVAPPYLLLVASAIGRLRPVWMRNAVLIVLACWAMVSASVLAVRSDGGYIWCAWETLARQAAEAEGGRNQPFKVYAFEDLVAYHAWFALSSMRPGEFKVEVVKGIDGLREDPAYFLPRGFDEVKTTDGADAFAEEHFWIAFRDTAWKPESEPLRTLRARGLETGQGFRLTAQGHTAFLVPVRRVRTGTPQ